MNEIADITKKSIGLIPMNYGSFGSGAENRALSEYTWNDWAFNLNSAPFEADTAIIVTSYHGQLGWLKATLTSYRKSGAFVILAYDNPTYIWGNVNEPDYNVRFFPHPQHYLLANAVVVKHKTYDADKRIGWFWDVWYAQGIIKNMPKVKYVYVTNGDCLIERPEGIKELPSILGDGDFMSGQSTPGGTIHTADMFLKVDVFNKILDYMSERNRFHVNGAESPEGLLRDAVDELGLKEIFVEQPINPKDNSVDYYGTLNADSTWKKVLGFRNLYHEFEYYENNGLEVPELFKNSMDSYRDWMYFREDWRNTICRYFETKDRRYLQMFWDRGKDTDTERKYLPLEAYGTEPIIDKE